MEQTRRRLGNLETGCYVVATAVVLLYLGVVIWLGSPIGIETLWPMIKIVIVALPIGYSIRIVKNRVSANDISFPQYLADIWSKISPIAGTDQKLSTVGLLVKHVLVATMEYNPALKAMFAQASSLYRQNSFAETLDDAVRFYGLKIDPNSEAYLKSFRSMSETEDEWLEEASKHLSGSLGTSANIISLLYYAHVENQAGLKRLWQKIRSDPNETARLAKIVLAALGFVGYVQGEEKNLALVMDSFETFELHSIQSRYLFFQDLLTWSKNLAAFCVTHKLAAKAFGIKFPWLFRLLKNETDIRLYGQLRIVCSGIVVNVCRAIVKESEARQTPEEVTDAVSLVVLVLFFESQYDSRNSDACRDAAGNDLALKILYQFVRRRGDSEFRREKVFLRAIIKEVLSRRKGYPWIQYVRTDLQMGIVRKRIDDIPIVQTAKVLRQIERRMSVTELLLTDFKSSLRQFFDAELSEDLVLQLLKMQVIAAYLVTTPSGKPIISEIVGKWMPEACEDLAREKEDPRFREMLMMEKGAGRYTRIGIVPVGMSFEDFSSRFDQVFERAVGMYYDKNPDETPRPAEFSANIIRIYPVEATFKSVAGVPAAERTVKDPAHAIRELFLNRAPGKYNLALMTTVKGLTLKGVAEAIFDQYTSMGLLLKDRMDFLVGTRKQLKTAFERKTFDKELLALMGCETLTQLAQKTYTLAKKTSGDKKMTERTFTGHVSSILKKFDVEMTEQERKALAREIFEKLYGIGLVLTTP